MELYAIRNSRTGKFVSKQAGGNPYYVIRTMAWRRFESLKKHYSRGWDGRTVVPNTYEFVTFELVEKEVVK